MAQKRPSIPSGTRDFSPEISARRNYIFDIIRSVFVRYGYAQIETPAMENLSTLMGKYGEEGDKLLFKILNSGDFLAGVDHSENAAKMATKICDKGLRYDLTVPFARYVVQHRDEIVFPFKRFQIQPVWRADRPQKGRYREFYQCDVDVIGTPSLLCEVELVQIVEEVFNALKINALLKINNRKILLGIAQTIGFEEKIVDITVAIDKLDKIGLEAVNQELIARGLTEEAVAKLQPIITLAGSNAEKLDAISSLISASEVGMKGIDEVRQVLQYVDMLGVALPVELDLSLARGLNYYTGAIFEVKARDYEIGSICGGGRYDDLTGIFGMSGTSGVGISFGADRIFDVMSGLGLFPAETSQSTKALFVNFGGEELPHILALLKKFRAASIRAELYPDAAKLRKQFEFAEKRSIPYMIFVGESEIAAKSATVKNIVTGEQQSVDFEKLTAFFE